MRAMRSWLVCGLLACGETATPVAEAPSATPGTASAPAASAPVDTTPPEQRVHQRALEVAKRISSEVDCTASGFRWLCAATRLSETPARAPDATRVLIGLATAFRPSLPIEVAAQKTTTVATLVLESNSDHTTRAGLNVLMPSESRPVDLLVAAAGPVAALLKGENTELVLPRAALRLRDLPQPDIGFITVDADGPWVASDKAVRLYHLADNGHGVPVWIAVQLIDQGGFLGIFPDVEPKVMLKPGETPDPALDGPASAQPPAPTPPPAPGSP